LFPSQKIIGYLLQCDVFELIKVTFRLLLACFFQTLCIYLCMTCVV